LAALHDTKIEEAAQRTRDPCHKIPGLIRFKDKVDARAPVMHDAFQEQEGDSTLQCTKTQMREQHCKLVSWPEQQ
jgi:hypothetical protein